MIQKLLPKKPLVAPVGQVWFVLRQITSLMLQADKQLFIRMAGGSFVGGLLALPAFFLEKLFLDTITSGAESGLVAESFRILILVVSTRLVLSLLRDVLGRYSNRGQYLLELKFYNLLNLLTARKYAKLSVETIEDTEFKDRYNKITRTTGNRAFRIAALFSDFPAYLSGMISSLGVFFFIEPLVLPLIVLFAIPSFLANSKISRKRYEQEGVLSPLFRIKNHIEFYLAMTTKYLEQRLLQLSEFLSQKLISYQDQIFSARSSLDKEIRLTNFYVSIPRNIFSHCLDLYAGFLAITGKVTIGSAFIFVRAVNNFDSNFQGFVKNLIDFYENYLFVSDLIWLLNLPEPDPEVGKPFPKTIKQGIKFSGVWFKYPGSDTWIVKDLNFEILPHQNIAIIGENGAGKSTLIKLLCGFYIPNKGSITVDGTSVSEFKKRSFWSSVSALFQDFENFSFSAKENIGYGQWSLVDDLDKIRHAAKQADIDEWIMSLPQKYDNPLTRDYVHGVTPSGGQLQRMGIARLLLKDGQIMILDEPTSNVDPEAEEEIFNHLLKIGKNKNLIFISHRFSTVRRADKILLLKSGSISESGTHEELMKSRKDYAKLFALQAKSYR